MSHAILDHVKAIEGFFGDKNSDKVYKLLDIKTVPGVVIEEPVEEVWVAVHLSEDGVIRSFAAFEWVSEDDDDTYVSLMFHGEGTGPNLKELRHTHWGDKPYPGYVFYMHVDKTIAALQVLKKYFDGD